MAHGSSLVLMVWLYRNPGHDSLLACCSDAVDGTTEKEFEQRVSIPGMQPNGKFTVNYIRGTYVPTFICMS